MMFLAPLFWYLGLGVAAGAAALHFIVTRQPPSSPLPTARFVPEGSVLVTTVAQPTDLWLLALRMLLAIVIGAAFARPVIMPKSRPIGRIVVADVSRVIGAVGVVRDSVRSLLRDGDVLVVFDSTAHAVERGARDSAAALVRSERPGHLSAALIAALRSGSKLRTTVDSFELVIVSPLRAGEIDGATSAIRQLWPGRIRLVSVPAAADSLAATAEGITVRAGNDDPVALATAMSGAARADAAVRIVRQPATPDDSVWAADRRHTLVRWPADGAPPGWMARRTVDTIGAVVAFGAGNADQAALVVPLERRWRLDPAARPAHVVARWVDGEPAAVEYRVGDGCIRDVAVPVAIRGDVMLRPAFARLLGALGRPCAAMMSPVADTRILDMLAGTGPLAARTSLAAPETIATPLVPWLLGLALLLAMAEILARRSKA